MQIFGIQTDFIIYLFRIGEEKAKPLNFNELPKHSSAGLDALDRLKRRLYLQESEKVEVQVKSYLLHWNHLSF